MTPDHTVVAAAALVDDPERPTRVLAARRSSPPHLAGSWEFPGGKVEPGEDPVRALHRELAEELGVAVSVGTRIEGPSAGDWPLTADLVLRLWVAHIEQGTPRPLQDHDELRWLTHETLHTVPWLPADRPMLPHVLRIGHPESTPAQIEDLPDGAVFVFGSNAEGAHGAGAARVAADRFGAVGGVGEGLAGRSYALPTMEGPAALRAAVERFCATAEEWPGLIFYLTKVGCGIAGYDEDDVAPLFAAAPANIVRPAGW